MENKAIVSSKIANLMLNSVSRRRWARRQLPFDIRQACPPVQNPRGDELAMDKFERRAKAFHSYKVRLADRAMAVGEDCVEGNRSRAALPVEIRNRIIKGIVDKDVNAEYRKLTEPLRIGHHSSVVAAVVYMRDAEACGSCGYVLAPYLMTNCGGCDRIVCNACHDQYECNTCRVHVCGHCFGKYKVCRICGMECCSKPGCWEARRRVCVICREHGFDDGWSVTDSSDSDNEVELPMVEGMEL